MARAWAVLVAATLLLLACTGGDGNETPTAGPGAPTGGASGVLSSATSTPTASPTPTTAEEFAAVLAQLNDSEYRISYSFNSRASGQDFTGALTWVRAADGRERFETSSEQGDTSFLLVVITEVDGGQITCFNVGGIQSCFRGEDGPFAELPNPTEIIFQNVLDPSRIDGVREIAGRSILEMDTNCYEVDAGGGSSEACIAEGNLLLYASWTAASGDGGAFEASEFSTTVSDADFEPIAPIED